MVSMRYCLSRLIQISYEQSVSQLVQTANSHLEFNKFEKGLQCHQKLCP